jgi:uncharacterized protein (TIGR03085 family)
VSLSRQALVATHRVERAELVATLHRVGPDAPTLCEEWAATQIASHLVASEAQAGLWWAVGWPVRRVLGPTRTTTILERGQPLFESAMRRQEEAGWPALLSRLESGPPRLFATTTLTRVRLAEDWIHHEDVRRAAGLEPRPCDSVRRQALIEGIEVLATVPEFRDARERVGGVLDDGTVLSSGRTPDVVVHGEPGEILLALSGRVDAARVTLEGDAGLLAASLVAI